jgi:hypothetical protein
MAVLAGSCRTGEPRQGAKSISSGRAALLADRVVRAEGGVCLGAAELKDGARRVLPLDTFLRALAAGDILG